MNDEDWDEILRLIQSAEERSRGYATYWEWAPDRRLAEAGVVQALIDHLNHSEDNSLGSIRPMQDDPPDVQLTSSGGESIGVEVTELVDPETVEKARYAKKQQLQNWRWADWDRLKIDEEIRLRISKKDTKLAGKTDEFHEVWLAIFTDEPMITLMLAEKSCAAISVNVQNLDRVFFILSRNSNHKGSRFPEGIAVFEISVNSQ